MITYKSIGHCTANEDGVEEISITRQVGIFEWSGMMLKAGTTDISREVTEYYVADGTVWRNKYTNEIPDDDKQFELFNIKGNLKQQSTDRMA